MIHPSRQSYMKMDIDEVRAESEWTSDSPISPRRSGIAIEAWDPKLDTVKYWIFQKMHRVCA